MIRLNGGSDPLLCSALCYPHLFPGHNRYIVKHRRSIWNLYVKYFTLYSGVYISLVWRPGGVLFRVGRLCIACMLSPCYALVWRVMAYVCGYMACIYGGMADHMRIYGGVRRGLCGHGLRLGVRVGRCVSYVCAWCACAMACLYEGYAVVWRVCRWAMAYTYGG